MRRILLLCLILCSIALGQSVEQTIFLNNFSAGELSPLVQAQVQLFQYSRGASTLENMLVRTQGPITRRPGTKYIASVKDADDETILIPFEKSIEYAYVIELGDEYARFFRSVDGVAGPICGTYAAWTTTTAYLQGALVTNSGSYYRCLVAHTSGTFATDLSAAKWVVTAGATDLAYEIVTPWDESDVNDIQYAQNADTMRLVHPDYEPHILASTGHAAWTCTAINSTTGPFVDENKDTDWTLTADATTGDVNIVSTDTIFDDDHVGALYQISHLMEATSITKRFAASGDSNSTSVTVQKYRYYDVITAGLWNGSFKIQRSYDAGATWEDVYGISYAYNGNIQFAGQELEETCLYRMAMRDQVYTSHNARHGEAFCDASFNSRTFLQNGVVEITTVTDPCNVVANVKATLASTDATWRWAEGAWSDYRGWPRTIEHHEGRVIYGGSASYPQTIWSSIIVTEDDDYDDFTANTESDAEGNLGGPDDVAWIYTLPGMNPIQWMKSGGYLLIGTSSGVGKLGQPDKPITPNFPPTFRTQNYNGCAYMQPVGAVDSLLYVERGDEKVRELAYRFLSSQYVAPDMTLLSEHITGDGIDDIAFQNRPDPVLWCVREDGELLSFTYQRSSEVMAWGRNDTGASGLFKSVATIPGSADEDELWAVVGRTVDSTAVKYVEQFQSWDWGSDQNDCWFVDCAGDDITDLARLEGETVALWGDGRPIGTYTVTSGIISPTGSYTNTTVGLPYTSVYETMPLVVQDRSGNYHSSQETNIHSVLIDFYKTLGCHVGVDSTNAEDFEFSADSFATTIAAITDYRDGPVFEGTKRAPTLYFYESSPVPMTIRSVKATVEVEL